MNLWVSNPSRVTSSHHRVIHPRLFDGVHPVRSDDLDSILHRQRLSEYFTCLIARQPPIANTTNEYVLHTPSEKSNDHQRQKATLSTPSIVTGVFGTYSGHFHTYIRIPA